MQPLAALSVQPMWLIVLCSVTAVLLLTLACLGLAQALRRRLQASDHALAANYFAMAGTFTALLLALLTVMVHERFEEARGAASAEANAIGDLFIHVQSLDTAREERIEATIRRYTDTVIAVEWPRMAQAASSPEAWRLFYRLGHEIAGLAPQSRRDQELYREILQGFDVLADRRRDRLSKAGATLPGALWATMFVGVLITLAYAAVMRERRTGASMAMLLMLSALIGVVLSVMVAINAPFGGGLGLQPSAFANLLPEFDRLGPH